MAQQGGSQVAGHPHMAHGVHAVGGESNFKSGVALQAQVFAQRLADHRIRVKDQNAVVGLAQAKFIFGADHALRHLPADFTLFDRQALFGAGRVKRAAHRRYRHFLAYRDIGGTADDFKGLLAADGNGGAI